MMALYMLVEQWAFYKCCCNNMYEKHFSSDWTPWRGGNSMNNMLLSSVEGTRTLQFWISCWNTTGSPFPTGLCSQVYAVALWQSTTGL